LRTRFDKGTKQGSPQSLDDKATPKIDTQKPRSQLSPEEFLQVISERLGPNTHINHLALIAPKVLFPPTNKTFPNVDVQVSTTDTDDSYKVNALLDSGATGLYVDRKWLAEKNIEARPLEFPLHVYNADGSPNSNGKITHEVELRFEIQGHTTKGWFHVVDLGNKRMIIGMSWLREHNPIIDWETGQLEFQRCPSTCGGAAQLNKNLRTLFETTMEFDSDITEYEPPEMGINLVETTLASEDPYINFLDVFSAEGLCPILDPEEINLYENHSTRIARDAIGQKKLQTYEDIAKGPYRDYLDVFSEEGFKELPPHRHWDHAIDLVPDWKTKIWKPRLYPLTPAETETMDKTLDELIAQKRIRKSKSPFASPAFFVSKKEGGMRMVIDYRNLNALTVKNGYPLPLIPQLVDKWNGCKLFTKVDVRAGYHNVRMKKGDEWKTAFNTHRGLYEWTVMPFGLNNAPATFQNMMNDTLMVHIRKGRTDAYIDDVFIGSGEDPKGKLNYVQYHEKCVRDVLQVFRENKLYLKPEKCDFSVTSVQYLGFVISEKGIKMDPLKLSAVTKWPVPTKLKELQSFIGFANFYRRFIKDFAKITRPFHDLTKKDKETKQTVPYRWTEKEQEAFDELKKRLTSSPTLAYPDITKQFIIETDASDYAYGAILSQIQEDKKLHPVAYLSHSFTETELNYPVYDKELMAIVKALKEWRHHLIPSPHIIDIITDHESLQWFKGAHDLNRRQARWAITLEEYQIRIRHRSGKKNEKADALSRRADHRDGAEDTNKQRVLLKEEWFINSMEEPDTMVSLESQIHLEQLKDPLIQDIQSKKESEKTPGWNWDDGLWRYQGKIYVPPNLRRIVYATLHSAPTAGHAGIGPTTDAVGRYYYWPDLRQDIYTWVQRCDSCQRYKNFPAKKVGKLQPNEIPTKPWEIVSMDLLTDLPESGGYDAVLVVVDRFSKMVRLFRVNKTLHSSALAKLCWDHVWKDFGLPRIILSDRGPQFASNFIKAHNELLGIKTALSTAYHPQSDGQSERMIQEVQKTLRMYVNYFQNDWADKLSTVEFALNNTTKSSTGYTPFYLVLGQHPNPGNIPRDLSTCPPSTEEFLEGMRIAREAAKKALEKAAESMKKFADRKRSETPVFKVGDKVLLDATNYPSDRPTRKFSERRYGPFKIEKKISDLNYRLTLPANWKIHPVFHVDQLRKYHEDPNEPNFVNPPPDLVEGREEFEVEQILDSGFRQVHGSRKRALHYKIKWKGYHSKDSTWEPFEHVKNSPELLAKFHKENPDKPKHGDPIPSGPLPKPEKSRKRVKIHGTTISGMVNEDDFVPLKNATDVTTWPGGPITNQNPQNICSMSTPTLDFLLLSTNATLPTRATDQSAGADLYSACDHIIPPKSSALIKTDVTAVWPPGYYARVAPRSGLALKREIGVNAGVIDRDYTGPLGVILINHGRDDFAIKKGDRIAQLILEGCAILPIREVKTIGTTKRGKSGFGSSGL
jgi:deoxyuridine 5'-triphosphate nucleotidohydrolase